MSRLPRLLILCGIPTAGKSTFANQFKNEYEILSRDTCRENLFGFNYIMTNDKEDQVTKEFNFKLKKAYLCTLDVIIDNTNCKEGYIDRIIAECPTHYDIEVKFFDIPLWRAYLRNCLRWIRTKKFIPFNVINTMKKNYDKINRKKYNNYVYTI